jgi:GNAT superfamily N-acetyltransferase
MNIRPLGNSQRDLDSLTYLMNQWDDLPAPLTRDCIAEKVELLINSGFAEILICVDDTDTARGYVCLTEIIFLGMEPFVEVQSILVDSAARRFGIGALLMKASEQWAAGRGIGLICLSSRVQLTSSHGFYESLGYTVYKQSLFFSKKI